MKKALGDHIGKKKKWWIYEIGELALIIIKSLLNKTKK